ncbi:MAG: hypothetical protein ACK56F_15140, partial [bacterium]
MELAADGGTDAAHAAGHVCELAHRRRLLAPCSGDVGSGRMLEGDRRRGVGLRLHLDIPAGRRLERRVGGIAELRRRWPRRALEGLEPP